MITTRDARRATRLVVGGARLLAALKVAARRRERRAAREALKVGREPKTTLVTGWDVA